MFVQAFSEAGDGSVLQILHLAECPCFLRRKCCQMPSFLKSPYSAISSMYNTAKVIEILHL